ncbi:hypothetical protein FXF61_12435 [Pseudomonas sp. C27(2019)]|uniref:restriction endonuclease subunit S n=1 Tax=Pseudomonas sp. C27(2019) TaxID=2604941 RepID=UPI0012460CB8|nr:restriction endonuclease subunit S [Pseudomonas sp. C27(2019)]QEY59909.1 hypothetical protein FXF61_12435 [Pseudomonas sp. C27(2019)]
MNNLVPKGWSYDQLGDYISESVTGEWGAEAVGDANDIPVLRSTNFTANGIIDYSKLAYRNIDERKRLAKSLKFGDIVLEKSGGSPTQPVGRVVYFDKYKPFLFSNFTQKLSPVDTCDSKFLFYKLYSEYQNGTVLKFQQQTTGIINFQLAEYLSYKSAFPPLPEQQKIATILTSVDTVIEKIRAQIDKLKHLKIGMMQQLLTQGIGHTEFKNTPIGRIPKTWKVISLGKAGSWKGGGTPSKANKEFWNGNIPWVSPKDMKSEFIEKTEDYITEHAITASSTNNVPASSILIVARSGILKHTLPVAIAAVDVTINQDMKALIVNDKVLALYLFHYLQANNHKVLRATLKAGNTVESLDFSEFSQYQIPLPPVSEQQKIIDVMESIANRLRSKQQLLKSYELTKKALMQDLLTGKVRVHRPYEV